MKNNDKEIEPKKNCRVCNEPKTLDNFYKSNRCKFCDSIYHKNRNKLILENSTIGIYKITSPTNKIYIGQSINIEGRWINYKSLQCKAQVKLYNSLKKHGPENHIFEIIEECSEDLLLERETYWKEYYKVLEIPSLCCKMDGKGGRDSEETKNRKSIGNIGKKLSQETINKISKTKKGKPLSEDHKAKVINGLKKRWIEGSPSKSDKNKPKHTSKGKQSIREKLWKPILQYDKQGNFIKEWPSTNHAAEFYQVTPTAITMNLTNRNKSTLGYVWKYKNK